MIFDAPRMVNSNSIRRRLFLVGCPRSGTTLLQSMLATHSAIASFPETHLLVAAGRTRQARWCTRLGLASPELKKQMHTFLSHINHADLHALVPQRLLWLSQYIKVMTGLLDAAAMQQSTAIWLEKTPGHLHYLAYLERYIPEVKFIHLVRNGAQVVASLYQVTRRHPQVWGGHYHLNYCIARWNRDIEITRQYYRHPRHYVVDYQRLLSNPALELSNLCNFMGVDFEPEMLTNYPFVADSLILDHEFWKHAARKPLHKNDWGKFNDLFDKRQQDYIFSNLREEGDTVKIFRDDTSWQLSSRNNTGRSLT
ncbi:MAG: sulfotransferase [Anaerolineae bacterium]|nr:sulfotransferase [Anaerolineae bacterium]